MQVERIRDVKIRGVVMGDFGGEDESVVMGRRAASSSSFGETGIELLGFGVRIGVDSDTMSDFKLGNLGWNKYLGGLELRPKLQKLIREGVAE